MKIKYGMAAIAACLLGLSGAGESEGIASPAETEKRIKRERVLISETGGGLGAVAGDAAQERSDNARAEGTGGGGFGGGGSTKSRVGRLLGDLKTNSGEPERFNFVTKGSSQSARRDRVLVIPLEEPDSVKHEEMVEDMKVMDHILTKALEGKVNSGRQRAMGIPLLSFPGSGEERSLRIEGYGAIFRFSVNLPLVDPGTAARDVEGEKPEDSDWEESKRELYGLEQGKFGGRKIHARGFDARAVEELKNAILESMRNASHLRHMEGSEKVTVALTSGGENVVDVLDLHLAYELEGKKAGTKTGRTFTVNTKTESESVLLITALRSDIDAFARGELTFEEFRKRAKVLAYQ